MTEEISVAYIHNDLNDDNNNNNEIENEILDTIGKNALSLSSQELRVKLFDKYWTCLIDREALLMKSKKPPHMKSFTRPYSISIDTGITNSRKFSSR